MKHFLKTFVILFIIQTGFAQGNFVKDSLDVYINRELKRWNLPGLAIAVVKDDKVVFIKGYGYADLNKKTPDPFRDSFKTYLYRPVFSLS